MQVLLKKSFTKAYNLMPTYVQDACDEFYNDLIKANNIKDLNNIKKLKTYKIYYRYKTGDYRVGFKLEDTTVTLMTVLHRKDIYKYFP